MNANIHLLDKAQTLAYAIGVLAPDIRIALAAAQDDNQDTLVHLTEWLQNRMAGNQNLRNNARTRLHSFNFDIQQNL